MQPKEIIQSFVGGIRDGKIFSIYYWAVVFTDRAVYFCNFGRFTQIAYPGIAGLYLDIKKTLDTMSETGDLDKIIAKSEKYYRFDRTQLNTIKASKNILGGSIAFFIDSKPKKLRLNRRKFREYTNSLSSFVAYKTLP